MVAAGSRSPQGYTLVEVMMVIAVVGIMSAAALPLFQPDVATQLQSFAQIVAADLQNARDLATTNNSNYRITFDTSGNRYYLEHSGANTALNTLPATIYKNSANTATQQYTDLDDVPQLGAGVFLEAVLAPASPPTTATSLEFGPLGSTTQAAETVIWLSSGDGDGKRYICIHVDPVTGLTQIDEITATAPMSGGGS